MRKERSDFMFQSATSTAPPAGTPRKRPALLPIVIVVLIVIVAIGTGAAYAAGASSGTSYACITVSHQGSSETIKTTGLLHWVNSQYYISCNEGSNLPTSRYSASCLTITPKTIPASIGVGASTEYYYISSNGSPISLSGATAPTNATEFINPANIFLTITC
jgi:hypothetical protein